MPGTWDIAGALRNAGGVLKQELPKFLNEDQAEGLKGVLKAVVPQDAADVGLSLMTGPFGKAAKLGGAALASSTYSPDAEAGGVSKSVGWLLKYLREQGLAGKEATQAVRNIQSATRATGNEHFWPGYGDKLLTSSSAEHVALPQDTMQAIRVNKPLLQAHSHPKGFSAAPSEADLGVSQFAPSTGALIVNPFDNAFSYMKSEGSRRVDPKRLEDYAAWAASHANDTKGLDWAEQIGLTNSKLAGNEYGPYEAWLNNNAMLMALRDQEVYGKLKAVYNPGKVALPEHGASVSGGALVDDFYDQVLR